MPLRVHCPGGCLLRLPTNRAGKMVRCPRCKSIIRIPLVSASELASGKPIPVQAEAVRQDTRDQMVEPADALVAEPADDDTGAAQGIIEPPDFLVSLGESLPANDEPAETPAIGRSVRPGQPPEVARDGAKQETPDLQRPVSIVDNVSTLRKIGHVATAPTNWTERLSLAIAEKYLVGRFFAIGMIVAGAFDLFPVVWIAWKGAAAGGPGGLPFWCWIMALVAALHLVYALLLWQIRDWAALAAVAGVQLFWAAVLAAVVMSLTLGGGQGAVARWLGLGVASTRSGVIWCTARLCLAVIVSYLLGREVYLWRRTERMLLELERKPMLGDTRMAPDVGNI